MLGGRRSPLRIKRTPDQKLWICKRCFHAQNLLHENQQPGRPETAPSSESSSDEKLSPSEAFRLRFARKEAVNQSRKSSPSPADIFRANFKNTSWAGKAEPPPTSDHFSLDELAEAYRKSIGSSGIKKETQTPTSEEINTEKSEVDEENDEVTNLNPLELSELSELDDLDLPTQDDVFAGENMRDYQGVLPLNGEQYVHQKMPLKQGALIESRRFVLFRFFPNL
jgi:hypothetical protein